MKFVLYFFLLFGGLLSPTALPAQTAAAGASAAPALSPGDVVRVTVWQQPELSGDFRIAADGSILHPLYNEVVVGGVPLAVAERRVRTFLSRYETNPQFVLQPLFRISVGGEVQRPDLYTLPPQTTIAQAVALAGGPTERAEIEAVRLLRGGRELRVDLTTPQSGLAASPIRSGDQIIVPEETSVFRDYILPAASLAGTALSLVNLILRLQRP